MPPGEPTKSVAMLERVARWLAQSGATRRSKVVAFGGGVIGDLAGLAAATYMRGVELIQVPTTLLAQVDSSVGGKVGIDLPEGKNLVGAFHAPTAVWIPPEALMTLPKREFINGAAEVWKYAFAVDSALLSSLESHPLVPESSKLKEVIARCIDLKRQIVEQDERDERGIRAVLNFGHTIGHALERASNYESLLHGEAIAIGMAVEARIGEELELSPTGIADQIDRGLSGQGFPYAPSFSKTASPCSRRCAPTRKRRREGWPLVSLRVWARVNSLRTCPKRSSSGPSSEHVEPPYGTDRPHNPAPGRGVCRESAGLLQWRGEPMGRTGRFAPP
ncbi:MAG: 3-dehydroquinate synthase [Fimbriimonadaceae bacterium]|nr:3-dehydroquinate synthase [Fimbriimonadaceae bacterium]